MIIRYTNEIPYGGKQYAMIIVVEINRELNKQN